MGSVQKEIIRSFASERRLIAARDTDALWTKYRYSILERLQEFVLPEPWIDNCEYFGSVVIDLEEESPAACVSDTRSIKIGDTITEIHLDEENFTGAGGLRADLELAANFMREQSALNPERLVVGVTYSKLARLVQRMGFEAMKVVDCDPDYEMDVEASYVVYCALNDIDQPFQLSAVSLPTAAFIERFATQDVPVGPA